MSDWARWYTFASMNKDLSSYNVIFVVEKKNETSGLELKQNELKTFDAFKSIEK